jgi:hypothetical protein
MVQYIHLVRYRCAESKVWMSLSHQTEIILPARILTGLSLPAILLLSYFLVKKVNNARAATSLTLSLLDSSEYLMYCIDPGFPLLLLACQGLCLYPGVCSLLLFEYSSRCPDLGYLLLMSMLIVVLYECCILL